MPWPAGQAGQIHPHKHVPSIFPRPAIYAISDPHGWLRLYPHVKLVACGRRQAPGSSETHGRVTPSLWSYLLSRANLVCSPSTSVVVPMQATPTLELYALRTGRLNFFAESMGYSTLFLSYNKLTNSIFNRDFLAKQLYILWPTLVLNLFAQLIL